MNNTVNSVKNDIYNTGTLNLNAGIDKFITFGGSVAGSNGVLSVNEDATIQGGTYVFKGDIDGQTLKMYSMAFVPKKHGLTDLQDFYRQWCVMAVEMVLFYRSV